ncbi:hypothetical protein FND56_011570, partial [Chryseoglobus frigidaquae]|nr:hypothetical protein [Microcella frigidaquae]
LTDHRTVAPHVNDTTLRTGKSTTPRDSGTRPLGASMGDLLSQAPADGGLGLGTTVTSVIFLGIIIGVATYLGIKVGRQRRVAASAEQDAVLAAA